MRKYIMVLEAIYHGARSEPSTMLAFNAFLEIVLIGCGTLGGLEFDLEALAINLHAIHGLDGSLS